MHFEQANRRATTMAGGRNVSWLLETRAERRGEHPFVVWEPPDGNRATYTYAAFLDRVSSLAAGLRRRGVKAGDTIKFARKVGDFATEEFVAKKE